MDFLTGFYDGSDPVSAAAGGVSNRAQVFKRTDRERDAAVGNRNLIDPAGGLPEMEHDHLFFYAGVAHGADGVVHQVGDDRQQGLQAYRMAEQKARRLQHAAGEQNLLLPAFPDLLFQQDIQKNKPRGGIGLSLKGGAGGIAVRFLQQERKLVP